MAGALKIAQFLERDGMAKMQIGRGRIHAELDPQRTPVGQLRRQFGIRDYFDRVAAEPIGSVSGLILGLVFVGRQLSKLPCEGNHSANIQPIAKESAEK